jgi:uncharacterized membrane protein
MLTDSELDALPEIDGFRQRGMDMTRLEAFTDAAFAFAVTMLVVGGGDAIPANFDEMIAAMKQVPAFAASFANIMLFWYAHHTWSRRFGLDDVMSAVFSFMLIFVVLIYVYPLKAIYSGALQFFTGGLLESYFVLSSVEDLRVMFVIFGCGYASLSLVIVLLNRHALRLADELRLSDIERWATVTQIQQWLISTSVPLISIVLALTMPGPWIVLAGLIYGSFGLLMPGHHMLRERLWAARQSVSKPD